MLVSYSYKWLYVLEWQDLGLKWVQRATGKTVMRNKLTRRNYGGCPEGKTTFGRPSCRWEDKINIQMCTDVFEITHNSVFYKFPLSGKQFRPHVQVIFRALRMGTNCREIGRSPPAQYMYLFPWTTAWRWPILEVETVCQLTNIRETLSCVWLKTSWHVWGSHQWGWFVQGGAKTVHVFFFK